MFYAPVTVSGQPVLRSMLDSGSMSCTLSEGAEAKLRDANVLPCAQPVPSNVVLVGCGGLMMQPKCIYELDINIYVFRFMFRPLLYRGREMSLLLAVMCSDLSSRR